MTKSNNAEPSDQVGSIGSVGSIAIKASDKVVSFRNKTDNEKPCCDILRNKTFYKELKEDPSESLKKELPNKSRF